MPPTSTGSGSKPVLPVHNFRPPQGELLHFEIDSRALEGNLLGDPARRRVGVYLPAGWQRAATPFPLLVYLASFTNSGLKMLGWERFGENLPQRLDRLRAEGKMGPVVMAFPDCFTSLGGNQYVDSPIMGRWEAFLLEELLPELERRFPVRPVPAGRGVIGFSSGGYGALIQGLRHGQHWGAVASHSGDLGFDLLFRGDFPRMATLLARHGGEAGNLLRAVRSAPKVRGEDLHSLLLLAQAASYDPDPGAYPDIPLPFDLETCRLDPDRWRRWLEHDPLVLVQRESCLERLRQLRLLYLDCGSFDQYHLQYGARRFARRLARAGVSHRFEEFPDDHSGVQYRLDVSLPLLYGALSGRTNPGAQS